MPNPVNFTQGDNAILQLTAVDAAGNPVNIAGATFSTQMLGVQGQPVTFGNGQHAIINAALGQFTLTLAQVDTENVNIGSNKDIVTAITIGGNVTYYRGSGILTVNPPVPLF